MVVREGAFEYRLRQVRKGARCLAGVGAKGPAGVRAQSWSSPGPSEECGDCLERRVLLSWVRRSSGSRDRE